MTALAITVLGVLVSDQTIKVMFRAFAVGHEVTHGPISGVRLVTTRILLARLSGQRSESVMWSLWVLASGALLIAATWASLSPVLVGFLLGGSLSQAVETSMRGGITDCTWLGVGPAFNFADLALVVGALGLLGELLFRLCV